jgi:Cu/Ag efflux protein CusF
MKSFIIGILLLGFPFGFASAQTFEGSEYALAELAAAKDLPKVKGVIRRIDLPNATVTIKHEEIPNLGMAAMTMPFAILDLQMLQGFNNNDRILFSADMINNELTLMWIEKRP